MSASSLIYRRYTWFKNINKKALPECEKVWDLYAHRLLSVRSSVPRCWTSGSVGAPCWVENARTPPVGRSDPPSSLRPPVPYQWSCSPDSARSSFLEDRHTLGLYKVLQNPKDSTVMAILCKSVITEPFMPSVKTSAFISHLILVFHIWISVIAAFNLLLTSAILFFVSKQGLYNKTVISFPNEQWPRKRGLKVMDPCGPWCTAHWKKNDQI